MWSAWEPTRRALSTWQIAADYHKVLRYSIRVHLVIGGNAEVATRERLDHGCRRHHDDRIAAAG
ncbi:hypothetical protein GCM10022243_63130 [Saccharothrix violaceirubra]